MKQAQAHCISKRISAAVVLGSLLYVASSYGQAWPASQWPVSSPEKQGVDASVIAALVSDMEAGKYGLINHFLLIRHGYIVADHHFDHNYAKLASNYDRTNHQYNYNLPAWHPYFRKTKLHTLQSVTKSITSIAFGIAIEEGHIPKGVTTPAMPFFSDYKLDNDARREAMTIEDLLTMRSGMSWLEYVPIDDPRNSCVQLEASRQWIQFVLDQPMREKPGTVFDYNSGASVLLGKILRQATGKRIDAYVKEKLFEPVGIREFYWKVTPDGEIDTEGGLYLSAHDLARLAYLFLREGNWNGKQIVSREWVRSSTSPIVADVSQQTGRPDRGYGYQWWVLQQAKGRSRIFAGLGYGGQCPVVVPEHDLVAVFNAWNIHESAALSVVDAVPQRIIPAIRKSQH